MTTRTASQLLAEFTAGLRFEAIPHDVIDRAKICILDTVAVATFGARFPWSRAIAQYALKYGPGGPCSLLGIPGSKTQAPLAALANGAFAHAFEQDSLREPGAGVHPGATLLPAALALAEEARADGRALLTAFVAGCEVLFRIGNASRHSSEQLGFHAPGLTGPYGAAVAAGSILGLDAHRLAGALGIAGSLSAGLLAFSKAAGSGEVKRLHLGRAAESGVLAARLAMNGFSGPETVLEGRFGFLETYCREADPILLTRGLGESWETQRICIKRYPCHVTAHTAIQSLRELMAENAFGAADVAGIEIECAEKLLSHHDIADPTDIMQAQYSVPFCIALALHRDPLDPQSFAEGAIENEAIRETCRSVRLVPFRGEKAVSGWHTRISVRLRSGRKLERDGRSFRGMPDEPVTLAEMKQRFRLLTRSLDEAYAMRLFDHLKNLDTRDSVLPR